MHDDLILKTGLYRHIVPLSANEGFGFFDLKPFAKTDRQYKQLFSPLMIKLIVLAFHVDIPNSIDHLQF